MLVILLNLTSIKHKVPFLTIQMVIEKILFWNNFIQRRRSIYTTGTCQNQDFKAKLIDLGLYTTSTYTPEFTVNIFPYFLQKLLLIRELVLVKAG